MREIAANTKTIVRQLNAPEAEWLDTQETAAYLKVKRRTLLLWVRQGKVRGYVLSGITRRIWRFRKDDLDAMLFAKHAGVLCSTSPSVFVAKGEEQ